MLFGFCLVCFTNTFAWNWVPPQSICFDFEMFGTGVWMFSKHQVLVWWMIPEWAFNPSMVSINLCSPSEKNPNCGVELREGVIPTMKSGSLLLSSKENPINGAAKQGLWEGKIHASESDLRVEKIPQWSIFNGHRGACVITSEWVKSHLGPYRPSIESNECVHKHAMIS